MELDLVPRQRAIARVCFALEPSADDLEALGAGDRWLLYRSMVRDRLRGVLERGLPRTTEVLGPERFRGAFAKWLAEAPPRTRYLREALPAFVRFARPAWEGDGALPPWTADLASYEVARWEAWWLEDPAGPVGALSFDERPAVNPALRVLRLGYPVHRRQGEDDGGGGYPAEPVNLAVYRTPANTVDVWVLNDVTADLLDAWRKGDGTVADGVRRVAAARNLDITESFIDKLSDVMARFLDKGILLGSASSEGPGAQ